MGYLTKCMVVKEGSPIAISEHGDYNHGIINREVDMEITETKEQD